MRGLAYLLMASRQRGDAPGPVAYDGDRLKFWCSRCGDHMVRKDGDECPVCIDGEPR